MKPVIDPRDGDVEDDASSTKRRTMLSLAGSLLAEISLPKLILSWTMLFVVPGLLLGTAPLAVSAGVLLFSGKVAYLFAGIWSTLLLIVLGITGLYGARSLFRMAESSFWALNSLVVEPAYTTCRELLRHFADKLHGARPSGSQRAWLRSLTAALTGLILFGAGVTVALFAWPNTLWLGTISDLAAAHRLTLAALANSVVLIAGYLAIASLVWAIDDATMPLLHDLAGFSAEPKAGRKWRIAHLSDIHIVGERYGFRIESGRAGPRGNDRFDQLLAELRIIHAKQALDVILITGDLTDGGRSAEWSEVMMALSRYPELAELVLILPGNHDLNIVDRANPARLDLPMSPNRRLRRLRFLSAADVLQGARVLVINQAKSCLAGSLSEMLAVHREEMSRFSDAGKPRLSNALNEVWAAAFPMVLPPNDAEGLGVILLNSNADTHFSFTNALGMISAEQVRGVEIAVARYPKACWIIGLHHHIIEYPRAAKVLSERIGTALVNGNWFMRRLQRLGDRVVVMHGHRHVDWIGSCARLLIVSAPSPVMEVTNDMDSYFYIHTLVATGGKHLALLSPDRIALKGQSGH